MNEHTFTKSYQAKGGIKVEATVVGSDGSGWRLTVNDEAIEVAPSLTRAAKVTKAISNGHYPGSDAFNAWVSDKKNSANGRAFFDAPKADGSARPKAKSKSTAIPGNLIHVMVAMNGMAKGSVDLGDPLSLHRLMFGELDEDVQAPIAKAIRIASKAEQTRRANADVYATVKAEAEAALAKLREGRDFMASMGADLTIVDAKIQDHRDELADLADDFEGTLDFNAAEDELYPVATGETSDDSNAAEEASE